MKPLLIASAALLFVACDCDAAPGQASGFSKRIVGTWLGPRRYWRFHADGRWSMLRSKEEKETNPGQHWRIKGDQLIITYPVPHHMHTVVYTIDSLTPEELVVEVDGRTEEYERSP